MSFNGITFSFTTLAPFSLLVSLPLVALLLSKPTKVKFMHSSDCSLRLPFSRIMAVCLPSEFVYFCWAASFHQSVFVSISLLIRDFCNIPTICVCGNLPIFFSYSPFHPHTHTFRVFFHAIFVGSLGARIESLFFPLNLPNLPLHTHLLGCGG